MRDREGALLYDGASTEVPSLVYPVELVMALIFFIH